MKGPQQQTCIRKQRIGDIAGLHAHEFVEEDCEQDHRQQRLNDHPGCAHECLLVAHLDVPPRQKVQQLTVGPELIEIEFDPRFD